MMLNLPMFRWTLRALSVLSASLSILLLSGLVVQKRCSPYRCCELCVDQLVDLITVVAVVLQ